MNKQIQALYGLKWNPFSPEAPTQALRASAPIDSFVWRVEQLVRDGGFALITGEPGSGKTAAMRLVESRLTQLPDLHIGTLTRPQSRLPDFYREIGDIFGVALSPHNCWAGTKVLRECWQHHIEHSLLRPVLLADEAQEMPAAVLNELRLLSATRLDSRCCSPVYWPVTLASPRSCAPPSCSRWPAVSVPGSPSRRPAPRSCARAWSTRLLRPETLSSSPRHCSTPSWHTLRAITARS
jgi:hypothetical protein